MGRNTLQKAFTLIEMIVAISVFMIFLGYSFSSYRSVTQANRNASNGQKLYRDVSNILNLLAKDIRGNSLDFSCIATPISQVAAIDLTTLTGRTDISCSESEILDGRNKHILPLISADGLNRTIYKFENSTLFKFEVKRPNIRSNFPSPTTDSWKKVSTEVFTIQEMNFTVAPLKSPLLAENAGEDALQIQPIVKIHMESEALTLQTSYSSRVYGKNALYE